MVHVHHSFNYTQPQDRFGVRRFSVLLWITGTPVRIFRRPDSDDTNDTTHAQSCSPVPCAHDLVGTACLAAAPSLVSCHVVMLPLPLVRDILSPDQ